MDPTLARDYPRPLREAYRGVLRRAALADRHQQLLRLGEISLGYLGSLALADYRRSRASDPDADVEEFLATNKRLTMGQYLALFRLTQRALGRPEIFGIKRHEVNVRLEHAQRWVSAVRAVEYARRVGASEIGRAVEEGLKQPAKGVRWVAFWDELVTYRNLTAHADANGWPIDASGYFDAMTPLLEAALVEALRTEYIGFVLLEYPTAQLVEVTRSRTGWVQRFDGEYHGVPLLEEIVRASPPEAWESEIGCTYVLHRTGDDWAPHSRFHDLRDSSAGAPPSTASPRSAHDAPRDELIRRAPGDDRQGPEETEQATSSSVAQPSRAGLAETAPDRPPVGERSERAEAPPVRSEVVAPPASEPWFPSFSPWMLWGLASFGLLAFVGFLVTSARVRDVRMRNAGLAYLAATIATLVVAGAAGDTGGDTVLDALLGLFIFGTWAASSIHAFVINPRVRRLRAARSKTSQPS